MDNLLLLKSAREEECYSVLEENQSSLFSYSDWGCGIVCNKNWFGNAANCRSMDKLRIAWCKRL